MAMRSPESAEFVPNRVIGQSGNDEQAVLATAEPQLFPTARREDRVGLIEIELLQTGAQLLTVVFSIFKSFLEEAKCVTIEFGCSRSPVISGVGILVPGCCI